MHGIRRISRNELLHNIVDCFCSTAELRGLQDRIISASLELRLQSSHQTCGEASLTGTIQQPIPSCTALPVDDCLSFPLHPLSTCCDPRRDVREVVLSRRWKAGSGSGAVKNTHHASSMVLSLFNSGGRVRVTRLSSSSSRTIDAGPVTAFLVRFARNRGLQ